MDPNTPAQDPAAPASGVTPDDGGLGGTPSTPPAMPPAEPADEPAAAPSSDPLPGGDAPAPGSDGGDATPPAAPAV